MIPTPPPTMPMCSTHVTYVGYDCQLPPTPAPTISALALITITGTDPGGHPVCFKSQPGRGGKALDMGWSLDILGAPGKRIAVLRCDMSGKLTLTHVRK